MTDLIFLDQAAGIEALQKKVLTSQKTSQLFVCFQLKFAIVAVSVYACIDLLIYIIFKKVKIIYSKQLWDVFKPFWDSITTLWRL